MPEKAGDVYVRIHFSSSGREFRDEVKKDTDFKKAGEDVGHEVGEGYRDGFGDKLRQSLDDQEKFEKKRGAAIKGQTTKTTREIGRMWDNFYSDQRDNTDKLRHSLDDIEHAWKSMAPEIANVSGWTAGISNEIDDVGDSFNHSDGKARVFTYRMEQLGRRVDRVKSIFRPLGNLLGKVFTDTRLTKFSGGMRNVEDSLSRIGKKAPTLRNDFLNIISKGFGGIFTMASKIPGTFAKIGEALGPNVIKPLEQAGEAAATAGEEAASAGEGVGAGLGSIVEAAPAVIAALVGIELILGFAASTAMLMTGAVIALVAALSVALVGAIGAVYGVLLPLAAGIGAVALGFAMMDKKSKKAITDAIKPLKKELGELGGVARRAFVDTLFDDKGPGPKFEGIKDIRKALGSLRPIFRAAGKGLAGFTKEILGGFQSPGFHQFIDTLAKFMPEAFRRVGRIAVNVGSFLGSTFEAVIPMAREFLGWLEGLTQSWANMGKGRGGGKIGKFFADIGPTVDSVGHAIMQVIGLIGDLIAGPAQKAGGGMFQSIADNVQKFRDFLLKAKKDGSLEKFFNDAKKLAGQIGDAVINVGKFIAALDTDDNRKAVIAIAKAFNAVLRASIHVAHWIEFINHWVWKLGGSQAFHTIVVAIKLIGLQFKIAWGAAKWAWNHIMAAGQAAHDKMHALFGAIGSWFASRWHSVSQAAVNAWNAIKNGVVNMAGVIRGKVADIVSWFQGIPGKLSGIASHFGSMASDWASSVLRTLGSLPGDIVNLFSGLAGKVVRAIGSIDLTPHINWPSPPGWLSKIHTASGGVFAGAQMRVIGEAGPEAVVPLTGPLSAVDPSVRALSAFARGGGGGGSTTRGGRTVDIGGITVITPTQDAGAVAQQVINRIAAASYI